MAAIPCNSCLYGLVGGLYTLGVRTIGSKRRGRRPAHTRQEFPPRASSGLVASSIIILWLGTIGALKPQDKPANAPQAPAVKLGTNLVMVPAVVTDPSDRVVAGLRKQNFEIYDEKIKQEIALFSEEDSPLDVGIVFDLSGSMKEKVKKAREALRRFLDEGHTDDLYFLIGFNDRARLLQDSTPSAEEILAKLVLAEPAGRTAVFDAVYLGLEKARRGDRNRRALLVISDGEDNSSRYTYSDLKNIVREAEVQIYAIGIFGFGESRAERELGRSILEEITTLTGGRALFPQSGAEMEDALQRIGAELRHQYNIGFYPSEPAAAASWHHLRVKVDAPAGLPKLTVRAREGYLGKGVNAADK